MKNTRSIVCFLLLLVLTGGCMCVCAEPIDQIFDIYHGCGDYSYFLLEDGTAEIVEYRGTEVDVMVPSTLDGYVVSRIGREAFKYCDTMKSIGIPDSVTAIENNSFGYCVALTRISVSQDHPVFATSGGILFDKERKTLICYPRGIVDG